MTQITMETRKTRTEWVTHLAATTDDWERSTYRYNPTALALHVATQECEFTLGEILTSFEEALSRQTFATLIEIDLDVDEFINAAKRHHLKGGFENSEPPEYGVLVQADAWFETDIELESTWARLRDAIHPVYEPTMYTGGWINVRDFNINGKAYTMTFDYSNGLEEIFIKLRDEKISDLQRVAALALKFADQIKPDEG